MAKHMKRPGYMGRAVAAWFIFNTILFVTLAALVFLVGAYLDRWFVMIPMMLAVVLSEWIIMAETIAPVIKDWIKQEEYVSDGERPSWEKAA